MKRILPAFYAIAFLLSSPVLLAQPTVKSANGQYKTLENGKVLKLDEGSNDNLSLYPDMYDGSPLWTYNDTEVDGENPLGLGFLNVGTDIYLYINGGSWAAAEKKTVIKRISMEGAVQDQIQIPDSWRLSSLKKLSEDTLVYASFGSVYLFNRKLEIIKQVNMPGIRIQDFEIHESCIYTVEDDTDHSAYQVNKYNKNLELLDTDTIRVNSGTSNFTGTRIGFNTQGECFLGEYWYAGSVSEPMGRVRKLGKDMNQVWESELDTAWIHMPVFAPLDNGSILVGSENTTGAFIISGPGAPELLVIGEISRACETDSSYTFSASYRAYHYSRKGGFIPWYQKVFIEYPEAANPGGAMCFPNPDPVVIQLDAGYPGNTDITWSNGFTGNPLSVYGTGEYWANFDYEDGNKAYTDTFNVEDRVAVSERPEFELDYEGALNICEGSSLDLTVNVTNDNGNLYIYELEGSGSFNQTVAISTEGSHRITVTDSYGCATDSTIELSVKKPYAEELCMVSVDSLTGKNLIVWKKTPGQGTMGYRITRGFGHTEIGSADFRDENYLVDESSDPNIQAYRYFLTSTDTCGNSVLNDISHKTLHLTANVGTSGEVNLIWEPYEGVTIYQYNFYRSTDGENYEKIGALEYDPAINQWSDYEHPLRLLHYKVGIIGDFSCDLLFTTKSSVNSGTEIFSNVKEMNTSGLDKPDSGPDITLYPNPASDHFILQRHLPAYGRLQLQLISPLGNVVHVTEIDQYQTKIKLPEGIADGFYLVRVMDKGNGLTYTRKVLINSKH